MKAPNGWGVCLPWVGDPGRLWMTREALRLLDPEVWTDYFCEEPVAHPGYIPMVRSWHLSGTIPEAVTRRLTANPDGETWFLFNEPHMDDQDDCSPKDAANLVLKFLNLAHSVGSNVNWSGPNCAVNYPSRGSSLSGKEWHQKFLKTARQKSLYPSGNGIHMYFSRNRVQLEDTWRTLINEWRWRWLGKGPVDISEVCAENASFDEQVSVMDACAELLEAYRKEGPTSQNGARSVLWFAAWDYGLWPNCALCEVDPAKTQTMRLTPLGEHWKMIQDRLR